MKQGITETVLTYAQAEPPKEVRDVMRLSVLDWAACGLAGAREGGFGSWVATMNTPGPATRFDGRVSCVADAALVNATLSHALDFDDTHFDHIGHPSVVVVSAAFAVAEACKASMTDMIAAALVGAEASIAVGLWLGREHYQVGFHQTATAGAFGATVAAGRLMGLSAGEMRHALGLCATMASGLKAQFGTMGKPLNAGLAARTGVEAATWAAAGMTAAQDGLAGPLGFGATHHGAAESTDMAWRMDRISHKFHACCHGLHASLEAVRGVPIRQACEIEIRTHPRWMNVCNQPAPETGLAAKFSYAHVMAMAAYDIQTGDIAAFTDETTQDPRLVEYRQRVRVKPDETLTEMQARVLVDGVAYFHDLDAPLPYASRADRVSAKARALVDARADGLWQAIMSDDLAGFAALLAGRA